MDIGVNKMSMTNVLLGITTVASLLILGLVGFQVIGDEYLDDDDDGDGLEVNDEVQRTSVDQFIKIEGIDGESKDASHDKWIDVSSIEWSLPVEERDAATGLPTGKRTHEPIRVTKEIDKATPLLMGITSTGGTVDITYEEIVDGETLLKIEFLECFPTAYRTGNGIDNDCDGISDTEKEEITFEFKDMKITYGEA